MEINPLPLIVAALRGGQLYDRVISYLILGGTFLLLSGTGHNKILLELLYASGLGYSLKLASMTLIALVLGFSLLNLSLLLFEIVDWLSERLRLRKKYHTLPDFYTDYISEALILLDPRLAEGVKERWDNDDFSFDPEILETLYQYYVTKYRDLGSADARGWFLIRLSMGIFSTMLISAFFAKEGLRIPLILVAIVHFSVALKARWENDAAIGPTITVGYLRDKNRQTEPSH